MIVETGAPAVGEPEPELSPKPEQKQQKSPKKEKAA